MKNTLLFMFCFTAYFGFSQCADPIITDFECPTPSHPLVGAITTIPNPFMAGINTSPNIGQFADDGTAPFDNLSVNYGTPIDLSVNSILHVKVYTQLSTAMPIPFAAKLEGGATPLEISTTIDASNTWIEYTFDFSSVSAGGNTTLILFFNIGQTNGAAGDLYYIDELYFSPPATTCTDPVLTDFECQIPSQNITGAVNRIPNLVSGTSNTSMFIGDYTDNPMGSFDNLAVNYTAPIDLSLNNKLRVKIYTTQTAPLLVKLENGTSTPVELGSVGTNGDNIDTVNQWKEYEFDFSSQAAENHQRLVLFFNAGNTQANPRTFYIDDLRWESTTLSVENDLRPNTFKVFPNPASETLNISSEKKLTGYSIVDMLGKRIVANHSDSVSTSINISSLKPGVYFIKLNTEKESTVVKFIKQ